MAATLKEVIDKNVAAGHSVVNSFGERTPRSTDVISLQNGDVIKFADKIQPISMPIGTGSATYTVAEVVDGPNKGTFVNIFPSYFDRGYQVFNEPATAESSPVPVIPRKMVRPSGQPCDDFRAAKNIDEGMHLFDGKKLKVVSITPVRTVKWGQHHISTAVVYGFEYVDK